VICYSCRVGRCEECWGVACECKRCAGEDKDEPDFMGGIKEEAA
jgi:hypothetical protein